MPAVEPLPSARRRLVRPLALVLALGVLLLIPLKVISYGYLPSDDALRHAAKVVSDKNWSEILVVRDGIPLDSHPGWHALLNAARAVVGNEPESLVVFAVVALVCLFFLLPLFLVARPEAWLAALLAMAVLHYDNIFRLFLGRPFIVGMAFVLLFALCWPRLTGPRLRRRDLLLFGVGVTLTAWLHGSWYLLALPVAAMLLARQWVGAVRLGAVTAVGVLAGAALTGHPAMFLAQTAKHVILSLGQHQLTRMLVWEFQPSAGDALPALFFLLLLVWRRLRGRCAHGLWDNPAVMMIILCWILGFQVIRFWQDWGVPAFLVWSALEIQDGLSRHLRRCAWPRLAVTAAAGLALYLVVTQDLAGRWTNNLTVERLSAANPEHAPWLPEPGGIIYSESMSVFYNTFFENPHSNWRYIQGFEPGWMPPEDLEILRKIQWNHGAFKAYEPWVQKMRPQDRLIINTVPGNQPSLPALEWNYTATNLWVGRLPRPRAAGLAIP